MTHPRDSAPAEPSAEQPPERTTTPSAGSALAKVEAVEAIARILVQEGVKYMFGIPGSHTTPLFDAIASSGKIKIILPRHEQGCAFMADGYARVARQVSVCSGTCGPGATNLVTGLAASYADGIPVIAITGQTAASSIGRTAHQESSGLGQTPNQVELLRNVTKASFSVLRASKIPHLLRTAFRIALTGRFGPVNISIPSDVFYDKIPFEDLDRSSYRVRRSNNLDAELVGRAASVIAGCSRPVILAGQRALYPDATDQLRDLVERFEIPVVTPLNAKGAIDESHPLALGCLGLLGQLSAETYLRDIADCVIAVGENFEELTSLSWDPAIVRDKQLIHIDVDPLEIGRNYPVDVGIDGTIRQILEELNRQLAAMGWLPAVSGEDIEALKQECSYFSSEQMLSDAVPLKPQRVMKELRDALPASTIVFGDSGHTIRWAGKYFPSATQSFFAANLFEPMGYGVAACIGGKLAAPDRPVVSICGDGSFLMTGMEISTAVNYDIPVVWVIINDSRLNMVYYTQTVYFSGRHVATEFTNPDYVKLAEAFGAVGFRVDRSEQIGPALRAALAANRPAIVDIHIDPDEVPPMRPRALIVGKEMRLPTPTPTRGAITAMTQMMRESKRARRITESFHAKRVSKE